MSSENKTSDVIKLEIRRPGPRPPDIPGSAAATAELKIAHIDWDITPMVQVSDGESEIVWDIKLFNDNLELVSGLDIGPDFSMNAANVSPAANWTLNPTYGDVPELDGIVTSPDPSRGNLRVDYDYFGGEQNSVSEEIAFVKVELDNTDEEEFFRSTSDTMHFTVVPDSFADSLSVSLEGSDNQHWTATFDKTTRKIDLVNLIEASSPMAWLDEQMLSISAGIAGVAGEWNWTKKLDLKKRMDGIKDNIMESLAQTLAEEFATAPGEYTDGLVEDIMNDQKAIDSNGIERKFNEIRRGEVGDRVQEKINDAWSDFTGTTIRGNIDSQNLHNQVTDESWTWEWNTELTINVTGGDISVNSGGNPHLNPGDWIRAVNDYGWSQKLFEPQKTSLTSTLTGDGHAGHALFKAQLFGEVLCTFDGYEDPETHEMTNGGQFSGLTVGIMLKCWF